MLIIYFTGFASAIYCLAPVPESAAVAVPHENSFEYSVIKSDEFAQSFNVGMHKCIDFGKKAARFAGEFIKQKLDDRLETES